MASTETSITFDSMDSFERQSGSVEDRRQRVEKRETRMCWAERRALSLEAILCTIKRVESVSSVCEPSSESVVVWGLTLSGVSDAAATMSGVGSE